MSHHFNIPSLSLSPLAFINSRAGHCGRGKRIIPPRINCPK